MNPDAHSPDPGPGDKKHLRKILRAARRDLGDAAQATAAHGLLARLLEMPEFLAADRIALYLPNDGEIDTREVIRWCQDNGRKPCLPVVQRSDNRNWLLFADYQPGTELLPNNLGIPEPQVDPSALISARDLDLVLLPLVGFDASGNRIGMGGGFYDTTFEFVRQESAAKPRMAGIAHEVQKVPEIQFESWDIPLPVVVTDQNVYRFNS